MKRILQKCLEQDLAEQLCNVFVEKASCVSQTTAHQKRQYFHKNYPQIIIDFCRFIKYVEFSQIEGFERDFFLLIKNRESNTILRYFARFVSQPSRDTYEGKIAAGKKSRAENNSLMSYQEMKKEWQFHKRLEEDVQKSKKRENLQNQSLKP